MAACLMKASVLVTPVTSQVACVARSQGSSFLGARPVYAGASSSGRIVAAKGEWLPGYASPKYLDGSLPGDNGFDPLNLGADPQNLKWFQQAELQNGRWAMLGAAGAIVPELLTKIGVWNAPVWYEAGKAEYFAPASTLFLVQMILMGWAEARRWVDITNPGSMNEDPLFKGNKLPQGDVGYPGGIFNPLKFPTSLEYKEKELANGRLAMVAFLGYIAQSHVTNKGPVANLFDHLADPWHVTVVQSLETFTN